MLCIHVSLMCFTVSEVIVAAEEVRGNVTCFAA